MLILSHFDDFLEALQFSSDDELGCELLIEIHCALLKQLVNGENDENGALQISLPDLPQDDDDDEDEDEEKESEEQTPTPEPEAPQRMSTRSSLHKVENASDQRSRSRSNTADLYEFTKRKRCSKSTIGLTDYENATFKTEVGKRYSQGSSTKLLVDPH